MPRPDLPNKRPRTEGDILDPLALQSPKAVLDPAALSRTVSGDILLKLLSPDGCLDMLKGCCILMLWCLDVTSSYCRVFHLCVAMQLAQWTGNLKQES